MDEVLDFPKAYPSLYAENLQKYSRLKKTAAANIFLKKRKPSVTITIISSKI